MRVLCALLGTVAAWLQPVQPPRRHVLRRHLLEKPADVASTPPATGVSTLVLLRHGESVWNVKDDERFTGWCDVPLTVKGEREAEAAGRTLRDSNLRVGVCFTSLLSRPRSPPGVRGRESLAACARRLEPFWTSDVAPAVRSGLTVLVVGHANSLRALLRIVFRRQVTEAQIRALKVPTGVPLIYHLDERPCEADESDFCALGLGAEPDWELVPRPPPPGCVPRGRFLYPLDECPVAYDDASAPHFYLG
ncbi:hypothetical protein JL720_6733 [Aureococcus anophagefferens]|nr:hypothetical protein JL720_6733 [Aureococcus anophagefferens]